MTSTQKGKVSSDASAILSAYDLISSAAELERLHDEEGGEALDSQLTVKLMVN